MRRTPYYYQFTYNSQGKISESKIFLAKYEEEVSTMKPDTLAPLEKYFWEGDKLVKLQQIRPNGTVRTEFLNEYDNQARLVSVKNQSPNDSEIYMSTYEYDSNGRLSKRIDRLTGRRNSKDYTNEIVYIEQYEYTTQKHPESLLKNSDLPYDIFGNDPWREWTPSKIIRAQFDYQENKLKQLRDIRIIVNKATADNIATEIELNMPIVSNQMEETFQQRIEVYAINTLCK
jgi:YD repeat-containing protein